MEGPGGIRGLSVCREGGPTRLAGTARGVLVASRDEAAFVVTDLGFAVEELPTALYDFGGDGERPAGSGSQQAELHRGGSEAAGGDSHRAIHHRGDDAALDVAARVCELLEDREAQDGAVVFARDDLSAEGAEDGWKAVGEHVWLHARERTGRPVAWRVLTATHLIGHDA